MAFHQKFREKFSPDDSAAQTQLPVFFGNVCLRFLPVLDIIIHRFLEVPISSVNKTLESILDHLGCLYKFHGKLFRRQCFQRNSHIGLTFSFRLLDRPISYLYNTLHFYERKLRDRPSLKRHLVSAVIQSLAEIRPANWALSEQYQMYVKNPDTEGTTWQPDLTYYIALIRRIADSKWIRHHRNYSINYTNHFFFSDFWQEYLLFEWLAFQWVSKCLRTCFVRDMRRITESSGLPHRRCEQHHWRYS